MEIGYAINEFLAQNEIGWSDPMQEEWRTSCEKDRVRPLHVTPQAENEPRIRLRGPKQPRAVASFVIGISLEFYFAITPRPDYFRLVAIAARGEPGKRDVITFRGQFACEYQAVLADGAEIRRQPVTDIEKSVRGCHKTVTRLTVG